MIKKQSELSLPCVISQHVANCNTSLVCGRQSRLLILVPLLHFVTPGGLDLFQSATKRCVLMDWLDLCSYFFCIIY